MLIDQISKSAHLESVLIHASSRSMSIYSFYNSFMHDMILSTSTCYLPLSPMFQSEYQEIFSTALLVTPELSIALTDYATSYLASASFSVSPAAVFDSYTNNLNFYPSEGTIHFMLFAMYVWFLVYFVTTVISLK
jgi:uncharacterized membrane protein